ncbi:hypothetical protein V8J88_05320 [Massilia sp. W12]|uniref:hypothetical protein n=1 Tax=Massilia sp. W12 TaxID=3126507 RepID=UPI0030D08F84
MGGFHGGADSVLTVVNAADNKKGRSKPAFFCFRPNYLEAEADAAAAEAGAEASAEALAFLAFLAFFGLAEASAEAAAEAGAEAAAAEAAGAEAEAEAAKAEAANRLATRAAMIFDILKSFVLGGLKIRDSLFRICCHNGVRGNRVDSFLAEIRKKSKKTPPPAPPPGLARKNDHSCNSSASISRISPGSSGWLASETAPIA